MRLILALFMFFSGGAFTLAQDANSAGMQIYPRGKTFPFLGYSGIAERDATNHFSVTGPDYGTKIEHPERTERIQRQRAVGLPFTAFIGLEMHFHDAEKKRSLSEDDLRAEITKQVNELKTDPLICWWYIGPEELRFWKKNELNYLKIVSETIRANDPLNRPIWMYEPNHRTAEALTKSGIYQDVIGKGCYTNLAGYQKDRIWVRWSIEQELGAVENLKALDDRTRIALVMPELCADPTNPTDDALIPLWVRHDVYLGLNTGAKGVAIWSLFKRREVQRSWQIWYDSYCKAAEELCGDLNLGQAYLFGRDDPAVTVKQTLGPDKIALFVGDRTKLELGTITEEERKGASHEFPTLSARVMSHGNKTWVVVVNSHPTETIQCEINIPDQAKMESIPASKNVVPAFTLKPFEVKIFSVIRE